MNTPTFSILPFSTVIWAGFGYVYGKLTGASPRIAAQVLAIWAFADAVFFLIARSSKHTQRELKSTYALTNLIVNSLTLVTMKQFNLLSAKGTVALSCLTVFIFCYRIADAET